MQKRKIFNEHGSDQPSERSLINGNTTGIANLNSVKYGWAVKQAKLMLDNFWRPEKVSLVEDKVTIKELTADELEAYKCTLSFLIALDSMQTANLPNLSAYITAPEVNAVFTIQEFQEYIHSQSYQYLLQELFPNLDREEIYNYWRTNPLLLKRNKLIADGYQEFNDNPNETTFKKALALDLALEGIFFYEGFNFFYMLASRNKGVESAQMIKLIDNDEVTHVAFMGYLIKETFDLDSAEDKKILTDALTNAVEQEIEWAQSIYGNKILGISNESTEAHVKYLGNQRAKLVGLGTLYKGFTKNPYAYLDTEKRENFFETTVTEYSQSTAVRGWDDF